MEFWKLIAIITWMLIAVCVLFFLYFRKRWLHLGKEVLLGHRLHTSFDQLFNEIEKHKVSKGTLSRVSKHILWRLTRIGLFAVLAALIPVAFIALQSYLLNNQNQLLQKQNERIEIQNNLLEADRRSSLVFLMSNVLDRVDAEIALQRQAEEGKLDTAKFSLSKPLISRIVALSRAFRPYRMLEGDTLSKAFVSPERGQLFIALMENNLDSLTQNTIVARGDFSNATIRRVNLLQTQLRRANLRYADLSGANLRGADLFAADLGDSDLSDADLSYTDLSDANLSNAILSYADLSYADLSNADLSDANLSTAGLSTAGLNYANLRGANLYKANLHDANLFEVQNITLKQLREANTLYKCINLDPRLREKLKKERPCLFTEEGCK